MPEIIVAEHHDQVYSVWRERQMKDLKIAHVDFHCDMRGILIDRKRGEAFYTSQRESTFVDRGNYLAHGVMEGIVSDVRWVHDQHGGRASDLGPVVAYETDLLAGWHRLKHACSGRKRAPVVSQEVLLDHWHGPRPGEQLDIDWDGLASAEYSKEKRASLVSQFLSKDFSNTPEVTFIVYSPGYSDPDRSLFEDFCKELANKFQASLTELEATELNTQGERFSHLRKVVPDQVREYKQDLVRLWRRYDAAGDIEAFS